MSYLFKKKCSSIGGLFKKGGGVRNWFSKDNFIHALEKMNLIRDGKIKLVDTAGSLIATQATNRYLTNTGNQTPIFMKDSPQHWKRDEDEIAATKLLRDD